MKRILQLFLVVFFPWLVLLINDDPVGAIIAMAMQVTIIGWIPASIWARRSIKSAEKKMRHNENDENDENQES